MAKTIPQLTDATTVNATDELIIQQGGITKRATRNELMTLTASGTTSPRLIDERMADTINAKDFGAVGDWNSTTGTDNAAAIQAAINFAAANRRGGAVFIPAGRYLINTTLNMPANVRLLGAGSHNNNGSTQLVAGNVYGPAIRVRGSYCEISHLNIGCTNARRTFDRGDGSSRILGVGATNYSTLGLTRDDQNYGIWVESDDGTLTGNTENFVLLNVWIHNQPNDALVIAGRSYIHTIEQLGVGFALGHCVVIDNGTHTGRSSTNIPIGIHLKDCVLASSSGHGIVCGHPSQTGAPPARIIVDNVDCYSCATSAAVRHADYVYWLFGDQSEINNGAINGGDARVAMLVGGRSLQFSNNRIIQATGVAKVENDMGGDSRTTQGVTFHGINLISPPSTVSTAVDVDGSVDSVVVVAGDTGGYTNASNSNASRIEALQNIHYKNTLFGKAVNDDNTTGIRLSTAGLVSAARDSSVAAIFGRNVDNGDVVLFRQGGSTKGSVRVGSSAASYFTTTDRFITSGEDSPEGAVAAPVGSIYTRTNGGAATTLYIKESGSGNTGWAAK